MDNNTVTANIVRLRKALNLSQTEMAERLGISRTAYRNIESGRRKLISDRLVKIAEALNAEPKELLTDPYIDVKDEGLLTDGPAEDYRIAVEAIKNNYTEEIGRLTEKTDWLSSEIESLKTLLEAKEELIKTKEEIISMLKKVDSQTRKK